MPESILVRCTRLEFLHVGDSFSRQTSMVESYPSETDTKHIANPHGNWVSNRQIRLCHNGSCLPCEGDQGSAHRQPTGALGTARSRPFRRRRSPGATRIQHTEQPRCRMFSLDEELDGNDQSPKFTPRDRCDRRWAIHANRANQRFASPVIQSRSPQLERRLAFHRGTLAPLPAMDLRSGQPTEKCVNQFQPVLFSELILHYKSGDKKLSGNLEAT